MKRILILAGILIAYPLFVFGGDVGREILTVTSGTNAATAVSDSVSTIRGKILEIYIDMATATTGTVTVAIDPELTTMADIVLLTKGTNTADVIARPRFDSTDTAGTALTDDPPNPFVCIGDVVKLTGSSFNSTGVVIKAVIKYEKQK